MEIKARDAGKVRMVDLKGRLVLGDGDQLLLDAVQKELDEGKHYLILNLHQLKYLDSTGLATLVRCRHRVASKQGVIKLVCPAGTAYNIISQVGLHMAFEIFDDELKAVGSF